MKTSLGIWAFGSMVTRFVPGGYQPAARRRVDRRARAAGRRRARRPDRRLRVPLPAGAQRGQPSTRCARRSASTTSTASRDGPPPRPALRARRARLAGSTPRAPRRSRIALDGADFAGALGAHFILWPGIEGYNYPFQTPYAESWALVHRRRRPGRRACEEHGIMLFLEHKNSRAGDEDPDAEHRDDAARHPHAARPRHRRTSRSTWTGST